MITVTVYRKDKNVQAFEISGHANSGPYGYDLVCAAVSAVSFGAVNAIFEMTNVSPEVKQNDEGGYLYVQLPSIGDKTELERTQTIIDTMLVSLRTIERDYRSFIQVKDIT
ncbi:MAG TPA: ribosomal-processing cysteine protease Prp [Pseudogracilibacillus sp.]|nr:ribosomal-processing cysteine protease Prp [Pseudogracilibacillus sp.]